MNFMHLLEEKSATTDLLRGSNPDGGEGVLYLYSSPQRLQNAGFQVFTTVKIQIEVFWAVTA
jgi:hypothetical protein